MKNLKGMAVLAALIVVFSVPALAIQSIADSVAVITDHSGNARIYTSGAWKNAEINMPLYEGDAIKTSLESAIEITFDDATIVKLGDNTELRLTELKRQGETATTVFNLLKGKFMAIVDKLRNPQSRFEVRTKMAIAAVKGTELAIEAGNDGTNIGVYTGSVEFYGPNSGSVKGDYKVTVEKGNESGCGGSGIPGRPGLIKYMGKFEREFGNLRETVKLVRELKAQGGDAVYKWRIQKKLEKNGETVGESETEGTIGGTNANVGDVKNKIQKALKLKIKKELLGEKHHAFRDLKFVGEEIKADLHRGKTMTDVHGNRVRIEEFVFRPAENQIDLLTITLRDKDRLDYLRMHNIFNAAIPENPTKEQWRSMWSRQWHLTLPGNYLVEQSIKMSNIDDWIFMGTLYDTPRDVGLALPLFVLPKNTEILAFSKRSVGTQGVPMEVVGVMNTQNFINTPENNQFVREHTDYSLPTLDGQTVARGRLDKTFLTWANYSFVMTGYNQPVALTDVEFLPNAYTENNTLAEGGVSGDLSVQHTRRYNDGSTLSMNFYLINDYGKVMQMPDFRKGIWAAAWNVVDIVYNSNVEIMIKSNQFIQADTGIDIVSKLLWWLILNPQNVDNKTPKNTYYTN